jgi:hypothetical protein
MSKVTDIFGAIGDAEGAGKLSSEPRDDGQSGGAANCADWHSSSKDMLACGQHGERGRKPDNVTARMV